MTLRDYQATAVERALRALTTSGSAVLQMPTGAGKTKTATALIKEANEPTWLICHRQEIERQVSAAFTAAGIDHGIVSPRAAPDYSKPVQIVSVATLARRIGDLATPKLAIWDECHHAPAKSWAAIRAKLADAKHLGLTATPERLDGKGLAEWFNELIVGPSTRDLIDGGWLSDFRYFAPSEPDLTNAKLRGGDYRKEDIAKAMSAPVLIGDAIAEYQAKASDKRALVFCASVEGSRELVARFNEAGIAARHVDGTTPTNERDDAVDALASGEIQILSNVEVFTEGFDLPEIDAVFLLRPTKSLALFLQMIGRALRTAPGKSEALIFDHAGLWLDHDWFDLPIEWSLNGGARQRRLAGRTNGPRRCPECKEVREARVEVCGCGFEFPSGREIGEYDGVLREVRVRYVDSDIPDGCVTQTQFASMIGEDNRHVNYLVRTRGMPNIGGHPIVSDAMQWIRDQENIPEGCTTVRGLARLTGRSWSVVRKYTDNGKIPTKGGYPVVSDGISFLESAPRRSKHIGCESKNAFASRTGLAHTTVAKLVADGMPSVNGNPRISEALSWLEDNYERRPSDAESIHAFAIRFQVAHSTVKRWISNGMPVTDAGYIPVDAAVLWVTHNIDFNAIRLKSKKHIVQMPKGNEYVAAFARRIDVSWPTIKNWAKIGLPYDPKLGIPIQAGLEWVRDNRPDIVIPPEAWPTANDNNKSVNKAA